MVAHKKVLPDTKFLMVIPANIDKMMRERLFDDDKGRIPKGSISNYIVGLIKRDLTDNAPVDLLNLLED
jgi:hypothetical protein